MIDSPPAFQAAGLLYIASSRRLEGYVESNCRDLGAVRVPTPQDLTKAVLFFWHSMHRELYKVVAMIRGRTY